MEKRLEQMSVKRQRNSSRIEAVLTAEKEIDDKNKFYFLNKTYEDDKKHKAQLAKYAKEQRTAIKEGIEDRQKKTDAVVQNLRNIKITKNENSYTIMEKQTKGMDRAKNRRHAYWEESGIIHEKKKMNFADVGENKQWIRSINDFRNFKILEKHERKKSDMANYKANLQEIMTNKRVNNKPF